MKSGFIGTASASPFIETDANLLISFEIHGIEEDFFQFLEVSKELIKFAKIIIANYYD